MASRSITTCDFCEQEIKDDDIVEIHSPLGGCLEDACKACAEILSEHYDQFRESKGCLIREPYFRFREELEKELEAQKAHLRNATQTAKDMRFQRDEARAELVKFQHSAHEECQKAIESSGKDLEQRVLMYIKAVRAVANGDVFFEDGGEARKWAENVLHSGGQERDVVRRNGLAWVRPSSELLRTELDFFASQVPLWSKIYGGKWVLVKAEGPAFALAFSVWDTAEAAYAHGVKRYGNVPMLIEQIPKAEE